MQRSSGQFIYAAVVHKFVRADFGNPTKRLALVLNTDPTVFSDLDQLYTQVLSVFPSEVDIVRVLGFIIGIGTGRSSEAVEDILEMEEGPHFAHASFIHYLFDSCRSGPFLVDQQDYENQIIIRSFALIIQSIRSWR